MDNKSVKNNIYMLRRESKLSQREAADLMGLSRNAYRAIEKGDTVLVSEHIEQIAKAFNTSIKAVLGYEQENSSLSFADNPRELAAENALLRKDNSVLKSENKRLEDELEKANDKISILEKLIKSLSENVEDKKNAVDVLKKRIAELEENE